MASPQPVIRTVRYVSLEGQTIAEDSGVLKRLYAKGQPLVLDFIEYEVVEAHVAGEVQEVTVVEVESCRNCGGIYESEVSRFQCICGGRV